jgi:hypothetical protein
MNNHAGSLLGLALGATVFASAATASSAAPELAASPPDECRIPTSSGAEVSPKGSSSGSCMLSENRTVQDEATQGITDLASAHYQDAWERFQRAYRCTELPTLAFLSARALEGLGKWVEASDWYLQTVHLDPTVGASGAESLETQQAAQSQARESLTDLLSRIFRWTIAIHGGAPAGVELSVDDAALPLSCLGRPLFVNPGEHDAALYAHGKTIGKREILNARERKTTTLEWPSRPTTMAWSFLATGVLGLAAGGIAGIVALDRYHSLSERCPNHSCQPSEYGALDDYNRSRTVFMIAVPIGLAAGAAGGFLLLRAEPLVPVRVGAMISPTHVGVRAEF